MIHAIMEAMGIALDAQFGDTCAIYAEEVPQNLERPCFFLSCIHADSEVYPSHRHRRRNQFAVQYFPAEDDRARQECLDAAERMLQCLETVRTVDRTPSLGTDIHYEIKDGVLHFFVNYNFFTRKRAAYDRMEYMRQSFKQKG